MKSKNLDIRREAAGQGVPFWQIADEIGMTDSAFSRKLRYELSQEEKEKILAAIDRLVKGRDADV